MFNNHDNEAANDALLKAIQASDFAGVKKAFDLRANPDARY